MFSEHVLQCIEFDFEFCVNHQPDFNTLPSLLVLPLPSLLVPPLPSLLGRCS